MIQRLKHTHYIRRIKMQKYDIQVTVSVLAKTEADAEKEVMLHMKAADVVLANPNVIEWELIEFIPSDIKQSCCC